MFRPALTEILRRLEQCRQHALLDSYALIGGVAVSAWGVPRATHDIDSALTLGSSDPLKLSTRLGAVVGLTKECAAFLNSKSE